MPVSPYLLHVARSVAGAVTVDPRLLALGVVAFALAAALIWWPALAAAGRRLATQRFRRQAAMLAVGVAAALALLPSVFPYDHLLPHAAHAEEHAAVHASHCHDSPGSCADAPVAAGPGQFLTSEPLVLAPPLLAVALFVTTLSLSGLTRRPELRPPLLVGSHVS